MEVVLRSRLIWGTLLGAVAGPLWKGASLWNVCILPPPHPAELYGPSMIYGSMAGLCVGIVLDAWRQRHPHVPTFRDRPRFSRATMYTMVVLMLVLLPLGFALRSLWLWCERLWG